MEIKIVLVDGTYKALVIDLEKTHNRLVHILEGQTKDEAYDLAQAFVLSMGAQGVGASQCQ